MKTKTARLLVCISFFLLFSAFLYNYLSINLWDYDFWWHISTGRYIVETGALPEKDPFSYTSELDENKNLFPERESFLLKQYWLSQIVFYMIYRLFGDAGIIIFRALIFSVTGLLVFWRLKRNGVNFYLCFIFVFLICFTFLSFTAERPVLFTMFFSIPVFLLLEEFRIKKSKSVFLLVPLMLLWANMHGGFILGDVIIGAFIIGETLSAIFKRSAYTKEEMFVFYSACVSAIAVSALNPNGFGAFFVVMSQKYSIFREGIQEHLPTFYLYKNNLRRIDLGYIILIALSLIIFIFRIKKMNISHIMVLLWLLIMSVISFRFVIYFVLIGAIIVGTELHYLLESLFKREFFVKNQRLSMASFVVMILLFSFILFINSVTLKWHEFGKAEKKSVPVHSLDFIVENRLSGNIYNDFVFGGYVIWRLYPWKKVFIDTRSINSTVLQEARWINFARESIYNKKIQAGKTPLWERLLDHYNVDIVLLDTLNVHGSITPLVLSLIKNDKWIPVHVDFISVVFVRDVENNQEVIGKHSLEKETVFNSIIARAIQGTLRHKNNPNYFISLGDVFYSMGRMNEALKAYECALKRLPDNNPEKIRIKEIKGGIASW